jgi:hypothetical protein
MKNPVHFEIRNEKLYFAFFGSAKQKYSAAGLVR